MERDDMAIILAAFGAAALSAAALLGARDVLPNNRRARDDELSDLLCGRVTALVIPCAQCGEPYTLTAAEARWFLRRGLKVPRRHPGICRRGGPRHPRYEEV